MGITFRLRNCLWSSKRAKFAASLRGFWVGVWSRPLYHTYEIPTGDVESYHIAHLLLDSVISSPVAPTDMFWLLNAAFLREDWMLGWRYDITHSLEYNVYSNPDPQDNIWSVFTQFRLHTNFHKTLNECNIYESTIQVE